MTNKMTPYQQFIHMTRYSRWLPESKRRETWTETVQRYVDFFVEERGNSPEAVKVLKEEVFKAIHSMEVMPSMRALMTAGEALRRENIAGFNCFHGDTRFVTQNGIMSFGSAEGTTQKVLAGDGVWRDAAIKSFGIQNLTLVTLRPGARSKTKLTRKVYVTPDHRWITGRGEVTNLKVGDTIPFNAPVEPEFNASDFIAGFGFGDGTLDARGRARIRLCSAKAKFLPIFEEYGNSSVMNPPSYDGDPLIVFHKGHFCDWKKLPETVSYWWFRGYMAADGHSNDVQPGLSTQDAEAAQYWLDNSVYGGYAVTGKNALSNVTNYGPRSAPLIRLGVREEIDFRVVAIEPAESAEVFCAVEPVTSQFTLEGGVLTGNCSYLAVNNKRAFSEALYILMCGTGVGFSCERQEINNLPLVPNKFEASSDVIFVADSKEGWAKAYSRLISSLYLGDIPQVDYSQVRSEGEKLKVFGGRASGPAPLKRLFDFTIAQFKKAKGRRLNSLEVHDIMCMVGEIVVVGGVRRSALISLSNLSDIRMRDSKSGQWWTDNPQRALANNSVAYTEKPNVEIFMEEWLSLVKSKSGERGIFNREAAQRQAAKYGRRSKDEAYGTNPCCTVGDTQILTSEGNIAIKNLVGSKVKVWNGYEFSEVTPFSVGVHPTVMVKLSNGVSIQCTLNHKFVLTDAGRIPKETKVEAKCLKIGDKLFKYTMPVVTDGDDSGLAVDAYSQGFYSGDGNTGLGFSWLYAPKYMCESRLVGAFGEEHNSTARKTWKHGTMLPKNFVPHGASLSYRLNWLAGLMDADAVVTRDINGNGLQLGSTEEAFLQDVRLMLTTLGVQAKVVKMHDARTASMPDGRGGHKDYDCKAVKRLLIGNTDTWKLMQIGFKTERLELHSDKPQRCASRFVTVLSVTPMGEEENFCFDEPKNHTGTFNGIVTGQSEIILRDKQFCNLSEIVIRDYDTKDSIRNKVRIATIIGTFQSSLTDFGFLNETWQDNTKAEALLGVSMTGIMDNRFMAGLASIEEIRAFLFNPKYVGTAPKALQDFLDEMRLYSVEVNKEWAAILNVNPSAAITAVKPSGTVSQLCDTASGIHARHNANYIRTVRIDKKDPVYEMFKAAGMPMEDDVMKPHATAVVSYPQSAPQGAVTRDQLSAIEQMETWLIYQRHWCEHKPSVTISVGDDEWMEVGAWVYKYFDEVSGISFLPRSDHTYQQAPYQDMTSEDLAEWVGNNPSPTIDWNDLTNFEKDDQTIASQTLACTAGACEI